MNDLLAGLLPIADRHQATIAQVVIAWTAAQPGITERLVRRPRSAQALENAAAGKLAAAEEIASIGKTLV